MKFNPKVGTGEQEILLMKQDLVDTIAQTDKNTNAIGSIEDEVEQRMPNFWDTLAEWTAGEADESYSWTTNFDQNGYTEFYFDITTLKDTRESATNSGGKIEFEADYLKADGITTEKVYKTVAAIGSNAFQTTSTDRFITTNVKQQPNWFEAMSITKETSFSETKPAGGTHVWQRSAKGSHAYTIKISVDSGKTFVPGTKVTIYARKAL